MATTVQPTYLMRIDLISPTASGAGARDGINEDVDLSAGSEEAIHMQTSYANLKHLQKELESALDELSGVHAQRLTRYIV